MLWKMFFSLLLFGRICEGFFNNGGLTINNQTKNRLNLTCSYYYDNTLTNCEYCVYRFFSNGSSITINYDCIQFINSYQILSKQCQGFSDLIDIGYGVCSPLSFELTDLSILCICATNMCNQNLTTCRSSVDNQIESKSAPSALPSIIPDLSKSISCMDTQYPISDSSNISVYCASYSSPYIDVFKCNEYVLNNTVLCLYIQYDNGQIPLALTKDSYPMYLVNIFSFISSSNQDSTIHLSYNETSSYFSFSYNETYNDNTTEYTNECLCAQDNCNYNLTTCFNSNTSITIKNNAKKNINNIFNSSWIDLLIKFLFIFISTNLIY